MTTESWHSAAMEKPRMIPSKMMPEKYTDYIFSKNSNAEETEEISCTKLSESSEGKNTTK